MTASDFRRLALALPGTIESSHFGNPDFRVNGKIFATLSLEREGFGVLLLSPEEQAGMVADAPEVFSPVPGGWGRKGSTRVYLATVHPDVLEGALRVAWTRKSKPAAKRSSMRPKSKD
ncbi:MAG: MmcQ/YjbR family DNA-binding protein [Terriglobales bacterium]